MQRFRISPILVIEILFLCLLVWLARQPLSPPVQVTKEKTGGIWLLPSEENITGTIQFAVIAYPTGPTDPAVKYVNFTYQVEGASWQIGCTESIPTDRSPSGPVYSCNIMPTIDHSVSEAVITISFDVYNVDFDPKDPRDEDYNKAPNGMKIIHWHRS